MFLSGTAHISDTSWHGEIDSDRYQTGLGIALPCCSEIRPGKPQIEEHEVRQCVTQTLNSGLLLRKRVSRNSELPDRHSMAQGSIVRHCTRVSGTRKIDCNKSTMPCASRRSIELICSRVSCKAERASLIQVTWRANAVFFFDYTFRRPHRKLTVSEIFIAPRLVLVHTLASGCVRIWHLNRTTETYVPVHLTGRR